MKRPLLVVGVSLMIANLIFNMFSGYGVCAVALFACSVAAAIIWLFFRRKKYSFAAVTALFSLALAALIFFASEQLVYLPALQKTGVNKNVNVTVVDYPIKGENRFYVDSRDKDGTKIRLVLGGDDFYAYFENTVPGDEVSFNGTIYRLGGGSRNFENYFKSRGSFLGAYPTGKISIQTGSSSLRYIFVELRHIIMHKLNDNLEGDYYGIAVAILLGNSSELNGEVYSSVQKAGIAHVFAVSGLHLAVCVLALKRLFELFALNRKHSIVALMIFVLFIMGLTGFSPSVCRAGLFLLLHFAAELKGKNADGLNSLGFAMTVMLLVRPYFAFNVSFLLSISATAGILIAALPISNSIQQHFGGQIMTIPKRFALAVFSVALVSTSAWFFTLPLVIYFFGGVSTLALITNLLIYPVIEPMIICFTLFLLLGFVPILGEALKLLGKLCAFWVLAVCRKIGSIDFSYIAVDERLAPFVAAAAFLVVVGVVVGITILLKRRNKPDFSLLQYY